MNRMTPEGKAKLEELIARVMKDGQARGIAVGIVNAAGEIQYENYFGYRDAENRLPITRDTIFGMASVTKSFTALSIMQMQQDGLLKVDDPVSRYIPEFTNKNQSEPVKLWHLMCHSGGYFPLPRIVVDKTAQEMGIEDSLDAELIYREDFAEEGIRRVAGRLDSQTRFTGRPGQRMSYCNDGFGLLSDIVRRHSGYGSFAEYLDKKILKPIGMDRSNISFIRNSQDENAAILYSGSLVTSFPSMTMAPLSTGQTPAIAFSNVDFPAPLPPITVTKSPSFNVRFTPRSAFFSLTVPLLKVFVIFFISSIRSYPLFPMFEK